MMAENRLPREDDERPDAASTGDDTASDGVLIHLRVPGPWTSPLEFEARLRDADGEHTIDQCRLLHRASGRRFDIGTSAHDDALDSPGVPGEGERRAPARRERFL